MSGFYHPVTQSYILKSTLQPADAWTANDKAMDLQCTELPPYKLYLSPVI